MSRANSRHRRGRPYVRAKAAMHAMYGYTCVLCGHDGAGETQHLDPVALYPDQPIDARRMRPIHGSNYPCMHCKGSNGKPRCCNQELGTKDIATVFKPKHQW